MPGLRRLTLASLLPLSIAIGAVPTGREPPPGQAPVAAQFASLRWLEGRWLGSGGRFAAFYEEYRFLNDSTVEQREIADSTFARVSNRSWVALREGRIVKLGAGDQVTATIRVAGDTAFFNTPSGRAYRWIRTGDAEWRAELGTVTYRLRRVGR